jgi:hypothetical protein
LRADADAIITIKLSGYTTATRLVHLTADAKLDLPLVKKPAALPTPTAAAPAEPEQPKPVGDNTLNPFE